MILHLFLSSGSIHSQAFICGCLIDISDWMPAHHLKLGHDKAEMPFFQGCLCPQQDISITTNNTTVLW